MWDQWTVVIGIVRRSWNLQIGNHGTRLVALNLFLAEHCYSNAACGAFDPMKAMVFQA